jgi:hypothetical protein
MPASSSVLLSELVVLVNSADFLSISQWKVDIFLEEKFSISVSYVYEDNIRKDFLKFEYLMKVTDQGLVETFSQYLEIYSLKIKFFH